MARPSDLIVDPTPLEGPRTDVAARIGWLMRTSRQVAGVSLQEMSWRLSEAGVEVSVPGLSRLERTGGRNGAVLDVYEQVLGLAPGRLRGPVDLVSRTLSYAPADENPGMLGATTLADFDAVVGAVHGQPEGGDWLRLARLHEPVTSFGLPSTAMRPLVRRLADELGRSVGPAFVARWEALARLRTGPYGHLVEEVARAAVADPEHPVHFDVSVVAEHPTPQALVWAGTLLSDESFLAARGGGLAIERMAELGTVPADAWAALVPSFVAGVERSAGEPHRRSVVAAALHASPEPVRAAVQRSVPEPLPRPQVPDSWQPTRRSAHFGYAERLAVGMCDRLRVPEQPMLSRLLFEAVFDFRSTRATNASYLLIASPFAGELRTALAEAVLSGPDETVRTGALRAALNTPLPWDGLDVGPWLERGSGMLAGVAIVIAGQGGVRLPERLLDDCLRNPILRDRAVYGAGMAAHPVIGRWATSDEVEPRVRKASAWWLERGGRVTR